MEKIKPEVIGFQRVLCGGRVCVTVRDMEQIKFAVNLSYEVNIPSNYIHKNGKPKFRLVYKKH